MGKRKNRDQEYIKKKIRKLERKLKKIPVEVESEDSSPPCSPPPRSPSPPTPQSPSKLLSPTESARNDLSQNFNTEDELPEDLLQALGTEGEEISAIGEAIRPELASRWTRIMQSGLGKEPREAIVKKYPTPINLPRAVAPIMNAEISASMSEISLKRDRRIINRQNLTGKLMTCLGKSLSKVLTGNINSTVLVEEINDAAKLAAEIYYQDSSSRKHFAMAGANKTVQDAVRSTTTDDFLFGADCGEKIRAAQAIQKAGSLIKTNKPPVKKQVNWRSPLQQQKQQRARGGQQLQPLRKQPRYEQPRQKPQNQVPSRPRTRYRR